MTNTKIGNPAVVGLAGFAAFTGYGSFWIGLGIIWMLNYHGVYMSSPSDIGYYLVAWTIFTLILTYASLYIHRAMTFTFVTLLIGFILLDLGHFGFPLFNFVAGIELTVCALSALYMFAGIIINDVAGNEVLPMGKAIKQ